MGRKKLWDERILLPLTSEMLERLDAALQDGEARLDLIRAAIEQELKRRERVKLLLLKLALARGFGQAHFLAHGSRSFFDRELLAQCFLK